MRQGRAVPTPRVLREIQSSCTHDCSLPRLVQRVAEALLRHGKQTLGELRASSGMAPRQLKLCLLVLLQQNCAASYLHEDAPNMRGEVRREQQYALDLARVLQSPRMPRMLLHTRARLGPVAEAVVHRVLESGRLRLHQIVAGVCSGGGAAGQDEDTSPTPDAVQAAFVTLVTARLLERVPPCHLPPPMHSVRAGGSFGGFVVGVARDAGSFTA